MFGNPRCLHLMRTEVYYLQKGSSDNLKAIKTRGECNGIV